MSETKQTLPEKDTSEAPSTGATKSTYYVPEYGKSVEATSAKEAVKIAKTMASKESKEDQ